MRAAAAALLLEAVHQQPATITSISRLLANRGYWPSRGEERPQRWARQHQQLLHHTTAATELQHQAVSTSQHFNISTWPQSTSKHCYNLQLRKEYFCSLLYSICLTISFNGIYTISI